MVSIVTAALTSAVMFLVLPHLQRGGAFGSNNVQVPSVRGLRPEQARMMLGPSGLSLVISEERDDDRVEAGHIIQQNPMEGSWVKRGVEIQVVLSQGKTKIEVPAVSGDSLTEAMNKVSAAGLRVGAVTRQPNDMVEPDQVVTTIPPGGENVAAKTPVNLVVSSGKTEAEVPKVVGKGLRAAKEELAAAGFEVGKVRYSYDEDRSGGVVLRQDPVAAASAPKGSTVSLVVNQMD